LAERRISNPSDPKEKLKTAYQNVEVAGSYEEERDFRATDVSLHYETEIIGLTEALRGVKGPILEVAVGTGRLCRRLRDVVPTEAGAPDAGDRSYVGLDVSLQMLHEAQKWLKETAISQSGRPTTGGYATANPPKARPVYLLRADAFQMPFPNEYFHATIGFRFIKHLDPPNRRLLYREIQRVLIKEGLLIFDFYGWRKRARTQQSASGGSRLTPQALRRELEENGFKLIKIYGTRHRLPALLSSPFRALRLKSPVQALGWLEIKLLSPLDELLGRSRGGIVVARKMC
jgi:ubiquinone/menaquinone biosynthesis C-methylase UbiE